jgi:hypothetical protein
VDSYGTDEKPVNDRISVKETKQIVYKENPTHKTFFLVPITQMLLNTMGHGIIPEVRIDVKP